MSKKIEPDFGDAPGPALHAGNWRFGEFELDESRRELRRRGELLEIEPKPLNLLMLMLRHPGELIVKNDLIDALWAGRIVTEAVLSNCVSKLREALEPEGAAWLKTVFGYGYRFDVVAELIPDEKASIAAPKLSLQAGDHIPQRPNWQLVRRLGRSGDSWLAEHIKTRARRVFKFTTEPHGLSALKREITIFRLLRESLGEKKCYVELLDWNFDAPPWFIEAEYCPAGSLEEWFEAQGGVSKVPLATRLDLVAQIAEALAEVHVIGVLHKDLKPANIFVVLGENNRPEIRLADFGSGRVLDAARLQALEISLLGFTKVIEHGDANSGTPLYLAPELLTGQPATVKADIYALGIILYQCVVGNLRRQLAPGWEQEVGDEMLREDIASASSGSSERRTADAAELARNLRTLESRRVEREAERAAIAKAEQASRALDRMRARRVGVRIAFAALAIGFFVSATLYLQARSARNTAQAETRRAEKVSAFLGDDMFSAVNRDDQPVRDLTVKQLLDNASDQINKRFAGEPDIAAKVYETIGRSYNALEFPDEAQINIERALKLHEQIEGPVSDAIVSLASELVGLKYPIGELPSVIEQYESIRGLAEQKFGATDVRVQKLRVSLARGRVQIGEWVRGCAELQLVYDELQRAPQSDSSFLDVVELALGLVQTHLARYAEAEKHFRAALARVEKERGLRHIDVAKADLRIARTYIERGRLQEATALLNQAASIASDWSRKNGSVSTTINFLRARLLTEQGNAIAALPLVEENLRLSIGRDSKKFDQSYVELQAVANVYEALGSLDKALEDMRRAAEISREFLGPSHPRAIECQIRYAEILIEVGRQTEASDVVSGFPATFANLPDYHPLRASYHRVLGLLAIARNDLSSAREQLAEALRIDTAALGSDHSITKRLKTEINDIPQLRS